VAGVLHESWIATLLFDLLTPQEALDRVNAVRYPAARRPARAAIDFVPATSRARLPLGLFGASAGAAAALVAAGRSPRVRAVVSRGAARSGRPVAGAGAIAHAADRRRPR